MTSVCNSHFRANHKDWIIEHALTSAQFIDKMAEIYTFRIYITLLLILAHKSEVAEAGE